MGIYNIVMARATTTSDVFNAVAEPRRRAILDCLGQREKNVSELVLELAYDQPSVSKHLRVLKDVSLVEMRQDGKQRLYRVNGDALKPVFDWTANYSAMWDRSVDKIKERAERMAKKQREQK